MIDIERPLSEVRAEMIVEYLMACPQGSTSKEICREFGLGLNTTQKLLQAMVKNGLIMTMGHRMTTRYAAHKHQVTAQAYFDSLHAEHIAKISRKKIEAQERDKKAREEMRRPDAAKGDEAYQVVVRKWPKPKKPAVTSVFDLAVAE